MSGRKDRRTDMTKLIATCNNFVIIIISKLKQYLRQLLHYITPGSLKILSNTALIYTNTVVK